MSALSSLSMGVFQGTAPDLCPVSFNISEVTQVQVTLLTSHCVAASKSSL